MTATTSISKKSFVAAHFKNKIIENKRDLIVISVLQLLGYPMAMLALALNAEQSNEVYNNGYEGILFAAFIALGAAVLAGAFVAISSFKYLYSKTLVDMQLSLPLTTRQRFMVDFFSGLTIYIAPAIVAWILGTIILTISENFIDSTLLTNYLENSGYYGIIVIVGMMMFYTLIVFSTTCCGRLFETILSAVVVNTAVPVLLYLFGEYLMFKNCFGISDVNIFFDEICVTSPIGNAIYLLDFYTLMSNEASMAVVSFARTIIISLLLTLAVGFTAYQLYKRRKAESVSKPYVYRVFYYVTLIVVSLCIFVFVAVNDTGWAASVIICGIVYFIMEIITNRGFKRFWMSFIRFGGTIAFIALVSFVNDKTDNFNIGKTVPDVDKIQSVSFESNEGLGRFSMSDVYYTNKDIINSVASLQEGIIDRHYNVDKYSNEFFPEYELLNVDCLNTALIDTRTGITITYHLKNGTTCKRTYDAGTDEVVEILANIIVSDEYIEETKKCIISDLEFIRQNGGDYAYNYSSPNKSTVEIYDKYCMETGVFVSLSSNEINELANAYEKDFKQMTVEQLINGKIYGSIYISSYYINEYCTNTIEYLKSKGVDFESLQESSGLIPRNAAIWLYTDVFEYNTSKANCDYMSDEYNKETIPQYKSVNNITSFYSYSQYDYMSLKSDELNTDDSELMELISVATPIYSSDDIGGAFVIRGSYYFIPAEYSELVQKVYDRYFKDYEYETYIDEYNGEYYLDGYGNYVYKNNLFRTYFYDSYGEYTYEGATKTYVTDYN